MKKVLIALEILIILLVGGFLIVIYSGWYNIAATDPHYGIVKWVLTTAKENSVQRHARTGSVPDLAGFDRQEGLRHFDAMCALCHGAPGLEPSEIGKGQNPRPPDLVEEVAEWTPAELFWIVSNGIKMTGMPGFAPTHAEEERWAIVAFLRQLPQMTPEDYRLMAEQLPRKGDHLHGVEPGVEPAPAAGGESGAPEEGHAH